MDTTTPAGANFFRDFYMSPACPAFPNLSAVFGYTGASFRAFCLWLGVPLGPLARPLDAFERRWDRVKWAMKTPEERLSFVSFGAMSILGVAAACLLEPAGDTTTRLVYQPRRSARVTAGAAP